MGSVRARLSIMMFLQFFIWGAWYVMAYPVLKGLGFDADAISWTYSVGPIAGIISPFFVGMIADRFFSTERVLGVLHVLGGAAMFTAFQMLKENETSPDVINWLFFAHMLCYFPTLSLTNSLALHNMRDAAKEFPLIRVFGTIGWIIAGVTVSIFGWDNKIEVFQLAAGAGILMGLYSFSLPHTPPPSAGKQISAREILGVDALVLLKQPSYLVFMVSSFLVCIPLAFYYQLAPIYADHSGLEYPAFKMSFGQMSEIFFMLVMPLFFARLGVKWMLFVGMLAWVARYALFALGADEGIAWMVLAGIILHGICYDFFFVTGQIYTDRVAPAGIRGQAQGMLVLFTLGLGMWIGAQVCGEVEKRYTPAEGKQYAAKAAEIETQLAERQAEIDKLTGVTGEPWLIAMKRRIVPIEMSDADKARVAELRSEAAELREARSDQLLKSVNWKMIWTVPAIGAAVILVLFTLAFRDDGRSANAARPAH
jgi:nucleoside transporter